MATRFNVLVTWAASLAIAALSAGCGSAAASLDPGPPRDPVFHEVEGLRWGMLAEEVAAAWGPGTGGQASGYEDRPGYDRVVLGYLGVPADMASPDVRALAGARSPIRFLRLVQLSPTDASPRTEVRADLVSRFGEPIDDAVLAEREHCAGPACEIFRTGECTLVKVVWRRPIPDLDVPARLDTLTHQLGCSGLSGRVPRAAWERVRGTVPTSFPSGKAEQFDSARSGAGQTPAAVAGMLGPPNLVVDHGPDRQSLHYLWLDGSVLSFDFAGGLLTASSGSFKRD